ncbi:MAG: hypothetical protein LBO67_01695, partial [Spirochaetaceae bacterium]|nr:hypothetical protein [Spirochaetaceae bacterium]
MFAPLLCVKSGDICAFTLNESVILCANISTMCVHISTMCVNINTIDVHKAIETHIQTIMTHI